MLEYKDKVVQEVAGCTCDRCQLHTTPNDHDWYEKVSIAFRGGFDSIFGDRNEVSIDLCQQCVKEILGPWLQITSSTPDYLSSNSDSARDPFRTTAYRYDNLTDNIRPINEKTVDRAAAENPDLPQSFVEASPQGIAEAQAGQLTASAPSGHWNYRIIETTKAGEILRTIHEVHYANEIPIIHIEKPVDMTWYPSEGEAVPFAMLDRIREALTKPILKETYFQRLTTSPSGPTGVAELTPETQNPPGITLGRRAMAAIARMRERTVRMVLNGTIWWTSKEVGERADPGAKGNDALVSRLLETQQIFAIERAGVLEFPDYEFDELGKPVPAMQEILKIFDGFSSFLIASWFESTSSVLDGHRPREMLSTHPDQVIAAARAHVEGPQHG